ncbi:MAG: hypothetical protein P1S60_15405, partial [Anaerolineae bacterium]|nr:hypothetical protein [Anaerolineae bacterium]
APNDDWTTHFANIRDTLTYLTSRYNDDPAFKSSVDAAVYRVLSMKLRLEPLVIVEDEDVVPPLDTRKALLGKSGEINSLVAVESLTRIFPLTDDLLPSAPQESDAIVIFTQEKYTRDSPILEPMPLLLKDEIANAIYRFYGPEGTGVVQQNGLSSFTFDELTQALNQLDRVVPTPTPTPVEGVEGGEITLSTADIVINALNNARWIVFASTGLSSDTESLALKRFLASRANLVDAQLAVFSFGPPYELDSTEVSKLDLYYTLYSTGSAFVDVAARALFRDLVAPGASPVDVSAVNYFVPQQTMPDPTQIISLFLVNAAGEELTATTRSNIHIGDVLNLRTGIIHDRNKHVIPNKTPVQFNLSYPQEGIEQTIITESVDGVALASVTLDRVGLLHITVKSDPAVSSLRLELNIRDDGVTITEVEPSPTPTFTPGPTETPSPTPTATPAVIPPPVHQLPERIMLPVLDRTRILVWALGSLVCVGLASFMWFRDQAMLPEQAVRHVLWAMISGLGAYLLTVVFIRWLMPGIRYVLIDREYILGLVSSGGGLLSIVASDLLTSQAKIPRYPENNV